MFTKSVLQKNGDWGKPNSNKVTVVLGAQWGDEGKGKVVDMLARHAGIVCRCQVNITQISYHTFKK